MSGVRFGLCCVAACVVSPAWGAATLHFDIESQQLSSALAAFARQSGLQLVYYSELAKQQRSTTLTGYFTAEAALEQLLAGSKLTFALLDANTVVIEAAQQSAAQGAKSLAVPSSAASDAAGGRPDSLTRVMPSAAAEEILVMARRRVENLQEVPISVTALATEQLEARGVDNTEALNRQLANVAIASTGFYGRQSGLFRMRGIPGIAIYVDGVVQGGGAGALQNVVETERIEVLRGPQGTLFGKNAVGGAIQYFSRQPAREFGARLKSTIGSFNRLDVTANVDLPVSATLFTKATAAYLSRDGYLPSTTVPDTFGSQRDSVARLMLSWRPNETVTLDVSGDYVRQTTNGNPSTVWTLKPVCVGDIVPAKYLGTVPNNPCVYQAVGLPIRQDWVYGASEQRLTASDYQGPDLFTEAKGIKSELDVRLSPAWSIKGLAGYRNVDSTGYADFDGTPYKLFDGQNYSERKEQSVELQALFTGQRFRGTTGLYYYHDTTQSRRMNWLANDLDEAVNPALNAAARAYDPAFGTSGSAAGAYIVDGLTHAGSEGWALFAEWTAELTRRFSITAGARFNEDTIRTAAYPTVDTLNRQCCVPSFDVEAGGPAIPNRSGTATFKELSPRVSLQYQWVPGLMGYITYSEGFGAGGFTGGNIPNEPDGGFRSYGPELLSSFEAGLRSILFSGRLRFNLSTFYGLYDDIQVSEELIPRFPTVSNAGEARIRGMEIEGVWSQSQRLTINYGLGWLDTAYTDVGAATNIRLDSPFAYAPEYSFTLGAQYQWRLGHGGLIAVRGDYGWQDEVIVTPDINTGSVIPAYGLAAARVTYRPPSGRWDVALYGTNLTNEYYRINGFFIPPDQIDNGTLGRPREWGVTFNFSL